MADLREQSKKVLIICLRSLLYYIRQCCKRAGAFMTRFYSRQHRELALLKEKTNKELQLKEQQQRFEYDLQCRQIEAEKQLGMYELELQQQAASQQATKQMEQLKLEIEHLRKQLSTLQYEQL